MANEKLLVDVAKVYKKLEPIDGSEYYVIEVDDTAVVVDTLEQLERDVGVFIVGQSSKVVNVFKTKNYIEFFVNVYGFDKYYKVD